ncbi:MAG: DNA translocase FtsK [Actinobacteria bacterium]|nr:DNA translocase FtsK [Actinomycetota bacterium]
MGAIVCVALAVFLACVLYFGWSGGVVGRGLDTFLRTFVGLLTYAVPLLLVYGAVLIVTGARRRPLPAASIGIVIVCLAFLLAAAADSFGLFADRPAKLWQVGVMRSHGGAVGEMLWAGSGFLLGRIGTNILVCAALAAGLLLVSGSSLGLWARRSRHGVAAAGRAARRSAETLGARSSAFGRRADAEGRPSPDELVTSILPRHMGHGGDPEEATIADPAQATTAAGAFGPAVSTHAPRLVDAARDVPELYPDGGGEALPRVAYAGDDEAIRPAGAPIEPVDGSRAQLSLADAAGEEAPAAAFGSTDERSWTVPDPAVLRVLGVGHGETPHTIEEVSARLVETLGSFGVQAQVIDHVSGPRVTRYELQLAPGTKVSRVSSLKADLAYALAATEIRVQAPIPGKSAVGVEVPNVRPNFVGLGDIYGAFPASASPLAFWLGKDIAGKDVLADLTKLIHLLVAGTTGSGKSACINCFLSGVLLRATPGQVRLILIDPKKVELSHFDGVPHLLTPVVTDMRKAGYVLANVVHEMERRYELMAATGNSQNLRDLNKKRLKAGEQALPYIVLVIDELADLMMVAPNDVESAITRLGQLGRGAGVHMVVATQRPSVDVITGLIKSNIPSRIAFAVSSQTDSRVILDTGGAESLLGEGDMLFSPHGSLRMLRVQGAFTSPDEMKLITTHWRQQADPEFRQDLLETPAEAAQEGPAGAAEDELLADAITTVVSTGAASVALLQRRLRVGYARAGRLVDIMEHRGIISGYDGSKARSVLITENDLPRIIAELNGRPDDATEDDDDATDPATAPGDTEAAQDHVSEDD